MRESNVETWWRVRDDMIAYLRVEPSISRLNAFRRLHDVGPAPALSIDDLLSPALVPDLELVTFDVAPGVINPRARHILCAGEHIETVLL
jgi:hypothetical protein